MSIRIKTGGSVKTLSNVNVNGAGVEKIGVDGKPVFLLVGYGGYRSYGSGIIPNKFTFNTSKYGGTDEFRVSMEGFIQTEGVSSDFEYVVTVKVAMNGVPEFRIFEISITGSFSETHIHLHMLNDQHQNDVEDVIWVGSFDTSSYKEILDIEVNNEGNNLRVIFMGGYKTIILNPSSENPPNVTWYNKDYPVFTVSGSTTTAQKYGFMVKGEGVKTARTV